MNHITKEKAVELARKAQLPAVAEWPHSAQALCNAAIEWHIAGQAAHWIEKHDALLAQQLETQVPNEVHYKRGYGVALSDAEEAIDDECRERVVTASDCIELIRNLGAEPQQAQEPKV